MKTIILILLASLFLSCDSDSYNNHHCGYILEIIDFNNGFMQLYINWSSGKGYIIVPKGDYIIRQQYCNS